MKMKSIKNILIIVPLMMLTAGVLNAQEVRMNSDTATVKMQADDNHLQNQEQTQAQNQTRTQAEAQGKNQKETASGVKQVRSARPDWSKARGARPASVERPSGSRIPKGVGRPAGAKGPGRK